MLRSATRRQNGAIDMITSYVDFREDRLFYYSPEEIFRFSKTLAARAATPRLPLFEFRVSHRTSPAGVTADPLLIALTFDASMFSQQLRR